MELERIFDEITKLINAINNLGYPNWLDYVQVIATIISVIISALAVIMAVRIPKKIAEKQDKIALFNKRFDSFSSLQKCLAFAELIKTINKVDDYQVAALYFFGNEKGLPFEVKKVKVNVIQESIMLQQLSFLFNGVDYNEVGILFTAFKNFVFSLDTTNNIEELKTKFTNEIDLFMKNHANVFLEALKTNCI